MELMFGMGAGAEGPCPAVVSHPAIKSLSAPSLSPDPCGAGSGAALSPMQSTPAHPGMLQEGWAPVPCVPSPAAPPQGISRGLSPTPTGTGAP